MSYWLEKLSVLVAVPKCYNLLTHETATGFQIVEPKDIPIQIPIISSPLNNFFHEELVNHLLKCGAEIEKIQRVQIFRKSSGFKSTDYFTFIIKAQCTLSDMMSDNFNPALINITEGISGCVFFSRDYYNRVSSEVSLVLQESPIISLVPLGKGE